MHKWHCPGCKAQNTSAMVPFLSRCSGCKRWVSSDEVTTTRVEKKRDDWLD